MLIIAQTSVFLKTLDLVLIILYNLNIIFFVEVLFMKSRGYFGGRKNNNTKPARKVIYIILVVAILLIPAILALVDYNVRSNRVLGEKSVKVSLSYGGELIDEKSDNPKNDNADELVVIFDSLINNIRPLSKAPEELDKLTPFELTFSTKNSSADYKCYFLMDGRSSYCIDSSNNVYLIPDEDADAFKCSSYAQPLYKNATPPNMFTSSGEKIPFASSDWYYADIMGDYQKATHKKTSDPNTEYNMSGAIALSFDESPDSCNVRIYRSGIVIYDGPYSEISSLSVESGTVLKLNVDASWEKQTDRDFHGKVSYEFKVMVRDPSKFVLNKYTVNHGDFILASCTNVYDASKIEFKSIPDINCTPIFYNDSGIVRSLIPFSDSLEAGDYELIFTYGATVESVMVTLTESSEPELYLVENENRVEYLKTTSYNSRMELDDIIRFSISSDTPTVYFRNEFIDYVSLGAEVFSPFSTVIDTHMNDPEHISLGTQYVFPKNQYASVLALNSGKVIAVGNCKYLGDYVIIEHGLGLRTLYAHLSNTLVKNGDIVACGETIGICGRMNEASPLGVYVMCFVYDVPINYEHIAGSSIEFYKNDTKSE